MKKTTRYLTLDGEQIMKARQYKEEMNYAAAAFVVAAADSDTLSMRILSEIQEAAEHNDGRVVGSHYEILRIIVATLKGRLESEATADWIMDYYRNPFRETTD